MIFRASLCVLLLSNAAAYQPSSRPPQPKMSARAASAAATAALSVLLSSSGLLGAAAVLPAPAFASDMAAQISLQQLPPTSVSIQIGDLPVVGSLVSGTYTKVPDGSIAQPSVVIKSPVDKLKAISMAAKGGHLEFDIGGKINTHLDVDIAADESGTAKVLVQSNLIPRLPFKNRASDSIGQPTGGKESQWNIVTNLGSGESYYFNVKSGLTQYERPEKF